MTIGNQAVPELRHDRKWIGKSIKRLEDPKLLRGLGQYIDDLAFLGMLHAAVVRSTQTHARIVDIDTTAALALPGVVAVLTGSEAARLFGPLPDSGPAPDKHTWRVLAAEKVRYHGEGVAVVVADSRYIAEDACALVDVTYEPLEPILDPFRSMAEDNNLVHDALGTNLAYERTWTFGEVEQDFAEADLVVKDRLRWRRQTGMPLDTSAAIGIYNPGTGELDVHVNSGGWTWYAPYIAAILGIDSTKFNMIPHIAGGAFGAKQNNWRAIITASMMSKYTGRPVKYVEDRQDHTFNGDYHGSDRYYDVELALTRDGIMTSFKIDVVDDYGAYLQFGIGTHGNALAQPTGPYTIRSLEYKVRAVLTNKSQQGAYRGFGAEAGNWALERMVDKAAWELGMDPAEMRRKNFIPADAFPYYCPTGNMYDSGNYQRVLDHALRRFGYDEWRERQQRMRAEGRHVGIGLVTCNERSVYGTTQFWFVFDDPSPDAMVTSTPESVRLNINLTGNFTVTLFSKPFEGNSPDTMAAMLVAEEFDVDPHDVAIMHAGTKGGLPAAGPGGSRLTVMLSGAIAGASQKIKNKMRLIAANDLEVDPDELEWTDGGFGVPGVPDARRTIADIVTLAYLFNASLPEGMESGMDESFTYDHPHLTMPKPDRSDLGVWYPCSGHACHVVALEVDVETGGVTILDYTAVHDSGTLVNPRSYDGQIIGGTAQGLSTALTEELSFDEDGVPLASTFWDYLMPLALDVPEINIGHEETPSPLTVNGVKGGGEAGRLVAPGVISQAIDDALRDFGARVRDLPATPPRILTMVREGSA